MRKNRIMDCVRQAAVMIVIAASAVMAAEPSGILLEREVFAEGAGYGIYRIPSLVTTSRGTLLAFAEGRETISDHAQNDIVLRRSTDGGTTWGERIVVAEAGGDCLNNPQAVVLPESGRVLLMYQFNPENYHARPMGDKIKLLRPGVSGPDVGLCFLTYSDDDGLTWSEPRDITAQVKRPDKVTGFAGGPGIGIVLRSAPHEGRIIMPFNESWFEEDGSRPFYLYAVYSDDGGQTWQYGQRAPYVHSRLEGKGYGDEVQMVELADGRLMLNSRSNGGNKCRKVAYSGDGGQTWSCVLDEPQLPEPECMGSILRYSWPEKGQKSRILFCNPASREGRPGTRVSRTLGTVYLSYDEGQTWPVSRLLYKEMFGYSCLTVLPDGSIGCLYEKDGCKTITFTRFPLEWLTDGK